MKKYIKLSVINLAVLVFTVGVFYIIDFLCPYGIDQIFKTATIIAVFLYLIIYGAVSCAKTKSVVYPNLILLGVLVLRSVLYLLYYMPFSHIVEYSVRQAEFIGIAMLFSLVPSIITKIIITVAENKPTSWIARALATPIYIKLSAANLIVMILGLGVFYWLETLPNTAWPAGVVYGSVTLIVIAIYNVLYGIVSCVKTKSIVFPNLMLLAFIVVGCVLLDFVIYKYSFVSAIDVISQYARRIMVALPLSLIPSIITKVIMLIADKCGKAKSQRQDGQQQA